LLASYFWITGHRIGGLFAAVLFYTLAQSILLSTDVVFRPAEQGRAWAIRRTIYEALSVLLILSALLLFHVKGAATLLALSAAALAVAAAWAVGAALRIAGLTPAAFLRDLQKPFHRAEIKLLMPFAANTALWVIYYRETNILLENFGTRAELADYRVAFVVITAALYLSRAVIWASIPRIAFHHSQLDNNQFRQVLRAAANVNLYIATFLTLGGLLYGGRLIAIAFGAKYANFGLAWILFDLALGLMFVQQFCIDLLNAVRRERQVVYSLIAGIAALTALDVLLIPNFGTVGAASAQLVACALVVPMNLVALSRHVGNAGLESSVLWKLAAAGALSAASGLALSNLGFFPSLFAFVLVFGISTVVLGAMPEPILRLLSRIVGSASQRLGWS
jgi:O-antigen/teichoic acid export membrane protein